MLRPIKYEIKHSVFSNTDNATWNLIEYKTLCAISHLTNVSVCIATDNATDNATSDATFNAIEQELEDVR